MEISTLNNLARLYGKYGSWAIWNEANLTDTDIILDNVNEISDVPKYVIVGLNISRDLNDKPNWFNFHDNSHCRKLCFAFNNDPEIRGAYMTDLVKRSSTKAVDILDFFTEKQNSIEIKNQVKEFRTELTKIGITNATKFILLGKDVQRYFTFFISEEHYSNDRIMLPHYSSHGYTDQQWKDMASRITRNQ